MNARNARSVLIEYNERRSSSNVDCVEKHLPPCYHNGFRVHILLWKMACFVVETDVQKILPQSVHTRFYTYPHFYVDCVDMSHKNIFRCVVPFSRRAHARLHLISLAYARQFLIKEKPYIVGADDSARPLRPFFYPLISCKICSTSFFTTELVFKSFSIFSMECKIVEWSRSPNS